MMQSGWHGAPSWARFRELDNRIADSSLCMPDGSVLVAHQELFAACKGVPYELKEILCAVHDEIWGQTSKFFWNCAPCLDHVDLLAWQKTLGAIPTCSLNSSMKRRELKPVLSTTSAILAVAGLARNFPTAYSTTGCPSNMPAARLRSATSTARSFSAEVGAASTRSRSSPASRPHKSSKPTCWLCNSWLGNFRKGTAPAGRNDTPTTQVCSSVSIA